MPRGSDHFEWVDLCNRLRLMVVALIARNKKLGADVEENQKLKQERDETRKQNKLLKEKNNLLKKELHGYVNRERMVTRGVLLFTVIVAIWLVLKPGVEGDYWGKDSILG